MVSIPFRLQVDLILQIETKQESKKVFTFLCKLGRTNKRIEHNLRNISILEVQEEEAFETLFLLQANQSVSFSLEHSRITLNKCDKVCRVE